MGVPTSAPVNIELCNILLGNAACIAAAFARCYGASRHVLIHGTCSIHAQPWTRSNFLVFPPDLGSCWLALLVVVFRFNLTSLFLRETRRFELPPQSRLRLEQT